MKRLLFLLAVLPVVASCSTMYYQFATVSSTNATAADSDALVSNNSGISISYDFWKENGSVDFLVTNETDDEIYLDLSKSFLIFNGIASDYFQNRTWSSSRASSSSISTSAAKGASIAAAVDVVNVLTGNTGAVGATSSRGLSVTKGGTSTKSESVEYKEKEGLWIPAHSSKRISEFALVSSPYRECGFDRFPTGEDTVIDFSLTDSPYVFKNMLSIIINGQARTIEDTFFVSSLRNLSQKKSFYSANNVDCNGKSIGSSTQYFKYSGPNMFYVKYVLDRTSGDDTLRRGTIISNSKTVSTKRNRK